MNRPDSIPDKNTRALDVDHEVSVERFTISRPVVGEAIAYEVTRDLDVQCRQALASGREQRALVLVEVGVDGEDFTRIQVQDLSNPDKAPTLGEAVTALENVRTVLESFAR